MEQNNKPIKSLNTIYADAKKTITISIYKALRECKLPSFMIESVLNEVLCDIKNNVLNELADEYEKYLKEITIYHQSEEKKLHDKYKKEIEELKTRIQEIENPK